MHLKLYFSGLYQKVAAKGFSEKVWPVVHLPHITVGIHRGCLEAGPNKDDQKCPKKVSIGISALYLV